MIDFRKDWLDKLNIKMPETMDQVYEALKEDVKNIAVLFRGPLVRLTRGVAKLIEPLFSQPPKGLCEQ